MALLSVTKVRQAVAPPERIRLAARLLRTPFVSAAPRCMLSVNAVTMQSDQIMNSADHLENTQSSHTPTRCQQHNADDTLQASFAEQLWSLPRAQALCNDALNSVYIAGLGRGDLAPEMYAQYNLQNAAYISEAVVRPVGHATRTCLEQSRAAVVTLQSRCAHAEAA